MAITKLSQFSDMGDTYLECAKRRCQSFHDEPKTEAAGTHWQMLMDLSITTLKIQTHEIKLKKKSQLFLLAARHDFI